MICADKARIAELTQRLVDSGFGNFVRARESIKCAFSLFSCPLFNLLNDLQDSTVFFLSLGSRLSMDFLRLRAL